MNGFYIVKKYIDECDYMSLLSFGAPADEYDIESRYICKLINNKCSVEEIAQVIADTFSQYFGNPEKAESFMAVAEKIKADLK